MKQAMLFHLFDDGQQRFLKRIHKQGHAIERDTTPDASHVMFWKLGILPPDDPRIVSTMQQLQQHLTIRTSIGGMARYTTDYYQATTPLSADIPGNPWIITTLWNAQWIIAQAKTLADLQPAKDVIAWVCRHASTTGVLPEQLHPITGEPISVAPLAWSHATYVETILHFMRKEQELKIKN
jgi:GH15 family glucan-1,4-alpha-glucosidase